MAVQQAAHVTGKIRAYTTSSDHNSLELQYVRNGKCTKWSFALESEQSVPLLGGSYQKIIDALAGFNAASDDRYVKLTTGGEFSSQFLEHFKHTFNSVNRIFKGSGTEWASSSEK